MGEFFSHPLMQSSLLFAALLAMIAGIAVLALKVRQMRSADYQEPAASDLLTNFREMHSKGVLSDGEYRTIRAKLTSQMQEELKEDKETG